MLCLKILSYPENLNDRDFNCPATDIKTVYEFDPSRDSFSDEVVKTMHYEQYGFIEAIKNQMYGNLDIDLLPKDLYYLNGILNLSEEPLDDLAGIEYCTNITGLILESAGLSRLNGIENLTELASLYLSGNQLEEIYCLENHSSIEKLKRKGCLVLI